MTDVRIGIEGRAGVIRLSRPQALNALSHGMCLAIDAALAGWADDPAVALVLVEGEGPRAFCAGGDLAEMYATGRRGEYGYGRAFWRDEYRMNARIAAYPKPVVSFLHGFTMGGGVGLGCHGSHRIVTGSSRLSMPECGIGLIPDVGGTCLLARAPGRLGEYLGLTGARMGPGDAILAGFADAHVAEADWPALRAGLTESGTTAAIAAAAGAVPEAPLAAHLELIDRAFAGPTVGAILAALDAEGTAFAAETAAALSRGSPLSLAATLAMIRALRPAPTMRAALAQEYRFTWRAAEGSDFLEGIRAQIIDKDRTPCWRHDGPGAVTEAEVAAMLAPLGADELTFGEELQ